VVLTWGAGHWKTKSGKWRAWATLPSGKRISKTHLTKTTARSWVLEVQSKKEDFCSRHQSLEAYIREWFAMHASQIKESTQDDYQKLINKHIIPHLGSIALDDLRRSTFDRFYLKLRKAGVGIYQIRYVHRILHKALQDAVEDRILSYNPAHGAKQPRKPKPIRKPAPLSEEQTRQLVSKAMETSLGPLIYLAVKTGMRKGELFALRWDDIDFDNREIYVQHNIHRFYKEGQLTYQFSTPKTASSCRTIRIGEKTIEVLLMQKQAVNLKRPLAGNRWQELNLVFPNSIGTPLNSSNVNKKYHAILEEAGLKRIRFHDMRHIAASIMLSHSVPIMTVSHILGHSQASTTLNMYGHHFDTANMQAALMMDDLFEATQPSALPEEFQQLVRK
jgi:integrase